MTRLVAIAALGLASAGCPPASPAVATPTSRTTLIESIQTNGLVAIRLDGGCPGPPPCRAPMAELTAPSGEAITVRDVVMESEFGGVYQVQFSVAGQPALRGSNFLDPTARRRLQGTWQITARRENGDVLQATWTPSDGEIDTILIPTWAAGYGLPYAAYDVAGHLEPQPSVGSFAPVAGTLRAGFPSQLRLEVCNRGAGPARRVYATTKSALPALHDLIFLYGDMMPSTCQSKTLEVPLPSGAYTEALVVVVLAEQHGRLPSKDFSTRLPVEPSAERLCEKGLTRAEYDGKLAELHKLREEDALTAAQVQAMEAELVGCLQ